MTSQSGGNKVESGKPQVKPLELLIISDQEPYRKAGEEYFVPLTTTTGGTLFNVVTATKEQLASSLIPPNGDNGPKRSHLSYKADVVLFDLRNGSITNSLQLPLLDRFLSRHKKCYAIASVKDDNQLEDLLDNHEWKNLQRDIPGTPLSLSQPYRFQTTEKKFKLDDYARYFKLVYHDMLPENILSFITKLKYKPKKIVRKRIVSLPTEFEEFSKSIRKEYGASKLVREALDIIAGFGPDDALSILEEFKPADDKGHSVPQHCYPTFEKLRFISQERIISGIKDQGSSPLSLYLHIPFCAISCAYCDYTTITGIGKKAQNEYLDLLKKEMGVIYNLTGWRKLSPNGIQIGGGTPSIFLPELIRKLGKFLRECLSLPKKDFQLTFEVSPGTTTEEKLDAFKEIGANRASIGLQSVADEVLLGWFDRWFSSKKGKKSVEYMLERWPDNTNIDMLYGLPGQTLDKWEDDLNAALDLGVPSITFYNLRVSPRTKFIKGQEFPKTYERMLMYIMAMQKFLNTGFVQSSDNQVVRSRENQPYIYKTAKKRGGNTLGIGLSSYSVFPGLIYFNVGGKDNKNPQNLEKYSKKVEGGKLPVEVGRMLDLKEQMRLFVTQGLKLSGIEKAENGVDFKEFERRFGRQIDIVFPHTHVLLNQSLLEIKGEYLGLTYKGLAFEEPVLKTYWR